MKYMVVFMDYAINLLSWAVLVSPYRPGNLLLIVNFHHYHLNKHVLSPIRGENILVLIFTPPISKLVSHVEVKAIISFLITH